MGLSKTWLRDAAERIAWTALQAAIATAIVLVGDLDPVLVAVLTPLLAAAKALVASRVGDPDSAGIGRRAA